MHTSRLLALTLMLTGAGSLLAPASTLYGTLFSGATPVYTVDQTNGNLTAIGGPTNPNLGDLTSDWRFGSFRLWGVDLTAGNDQLVQFDPVTGNENGRTAISNADGSIVSIAFDVVSGKMYGNTTIAFSGTQHLYEIDVLSGNATLVGRLPYSEVYALGFGLDGTLYGIDDVTRDFFTISTADATTSLIANIQVQSFDLAVRPEDGVMFALRSGFAPALMTIDKTTGNIADVGPLTPSENIAGLAFGPTEVPEPGTFVLAALGLIGAGFLRRRRRA